MQIVSIQILRAVAALSVAVGHAQAFIGIPLEKRGGTFFWSDLLPWGAGVDLFFVISGFIMVFSSEKLFAAPDGARVFVWRRVSRIVPLYWAATTILLLKNFVQAKPESDVASVLCSLFFIPCDTHGTGVPRPIYDLGWTLNYEMFFYALFALAIGFRREVAVVFVTCVLFGLVAFGAMVPQANPILFVWTQPITIEFVLGMGIALLARHGVVLTLSSRVALIGAGAFLLFHDALRSGAQGHSWMTPNDVLRLAGWGIPAAMMVAGAALGVSHWRKGVLTRFGASLGDASYALYLCHPMVMSAFAASWFFLKFEERFSPWLAVALSIALSCLAALAVHRWFEKPLTNVLQGKRAKERAKPAARPGLA